MWHVEEDLHRPLPRWSNHHCTQHHHHLHHYDNNEIKIHTMENGFIGVGQHQNHMYYPVSYCMVNDDVQEEEHHHHYTFSQMLMSRPPPPPTPEPSSLPSLMLSSPPLPDSYYVHHPFTSIMQQPQQPSLVSSSPDSSLTVGYNTIQIQQRINDYDYNERNSELATRMIKNDLSSSCFRRLHLGERTIDNSMKSTVIFDKNTQQQTSNNNNRLLEQANEIKTQFEITLGDDKIIGVCKRTILAAINKVIVDNYESALYKLRKTIRILDIIKFNEGVSGIETAKIDNVGPWLETLKDIERKITQYQQDQQDQNINGHHGPSQLENSTIIRTEDSYNKQLIQLTSNMSSRNDNINIEKSGRPYHFWWKSNLKRYRTTGKLVVEQRFNTNRRRYQRNN
ncbi:uncharacterized protein LOC100164773 [Acyrthosiphon pisum]|uniref:Uncharacterized protein n=1 Tax=Acyrthosiphon pisum TaxID=7029 RepID=A0A8R2A6W0_ACYPI|nr:uncharacterized protein LOC100164773 [Acyrthosiphon pisum]|eukprot:XP_001948016.4 PREDICTED: uncharacterized protein LOC100164773 [Acyrthosiphon pisum]